MGNWELEAMERWAIKMPLPWAVVMTLRGLQADQRCDSLRVIAGNSGGGLSSLETLLSAL